MGQDVDPHDAYPPGEPLCTHRDSADEAVDYRDVAPPYLHHASPSPVYSDEPPSPSLWINDVAAFLHNCWEQVGWGYIKYWPKKYDPDMVDPERHQHYEAKPLAVWLFAGLAALFLFWLQQYIYLHHDAWGAPFGKFAGYVRLGLMLLGAYCAFMAWPWRRFNGQTEADREAAAQAHDDFRRRMNERARRR